MRIVIDMQCVQSESDWSNHLLALTLAIAKNSVSHEVLLALNTTYLESTLNIRCVFEKVIPSDHIHSYETLEPVPENGQNNSDHARITCLIREYFITKLNPDVTLYTWLFNEPTHSSKPKFSKVVSADSFPVMWVGPNLRTEFESQPESSSESSVFERNIQHIKDAPYVIVLTEEHRQKLANSFGIESIIVPDVNNLIDSATTVEKLKTDGIEDRWRDPANQVISVLREFCDELTSRKEQFKKQSVRAKPLLAYVSPLPPERSGISDYSAELLPSLASYYDIEVIVAQDQVSDTWIKENCPIRSVEWFRSYANTYDRVLYHFGNSPFHEHMFSLLAEIPGIVVLHDFFLSHIVARINEKKEWPDHFVNYLYHSHGYHAVQEFLASNDLQKVLWKYPMNFEVIQSALEVIVHSDNSKRLAHMFYGAKVAADWPVTHLIRTPAENTEKLETRTNLQLSSDDFIVCSFGMLGPSKLNHRLLEAWLESDLAKDDRNKLIFVGQLYLDDYGRGLVEKINKSGIGERIIITDWLEMQTYRQYLEAADLAVQLRSLSRGETSAAVLDCMNFGLATIANANGSMADLPENAVHLIDDDFEVSDLTNALELLWHDTKYRNKLAANGQEVVHTFHNPKVCADSFVEIIESTYLKNRVTRRTLVSSVAKSDMLKNERFDLDALAGVITTSSPPRIAQTQLLVDVSAIALLDLRTGIQRVVRAQLAELLTSPPQGYRVEPVFLTKEGDRWHYRYARNWTLKQLGIVNQLAMDDDPVDFLNGDILFCADLYGGPIVEAHREANLYQTLIGSGIKVVFQVFDILPASNPEWFPPGASDCHINWMKVVAEGSSGAICISNAVATEFKSWLTLHKAGRLMPEDVSFFHLGADIANSSPTMGLPDNAKYILDQLGSSNSFLMVGTIEPRKGHLQTLEAFELLWQQPDADFTLVIVGNEGWGPVPDSECRTIPETVTRLRKHPESGKRLFWLEQTSDEYLEKIYAACTCLIASSEGEGFGLPLIEASQYKLPIIARDIAVFREVAGDHAFYCKGKKPAALAKAVKKWVSLYKRHRHPVSDLLPSISWKQSTEQLLSVLIKKEDTFPHQQKTLRCESGGTSSVP